MSDTKRAPSTLDYIETGAVCAVVGVLILTPIEHYFGETWGAAAIRSAILAVVMSTVVMVVNARKRRAGSNGGH
jgi:hypothetical protein